MINPGIADAVIRRLEQRGIVVRLSTGNLAAANKEGSRRDERARRGESSGRTTSAAGGGSSSLHQKVDELFEILRAKKGYEASGAAVRTGGQPTASEELDSAPHPPTCSRGVSSM